jgi:acyl carrier protein
VEVIVDPSQVKEEMRDFIRKELLGRPDYPLADDEPLITGGLIDSFSLALIGVHIETAFGVYIPDTDLTVANLDTLNQIAARILTTDAN